MFTLEELFCSVDDFCQTFEPKWDLQLLGNGLQKRKRSRSLCLSEIMTILSGFHQSCYRNFEAYYQDKVQVQWQAYFPGLVSYHRNARVDAQHPAAFVCLSAFLFWLRFMSLSDRLLLRKRSIIETIVDQCKNISPPIAFPSLIACQLQASTSSAV